MAAADPDERATINDFGNVFSVSKNHLNKVVHRPLWSDKDVARQRRHCSRMPVTHVGMVIRQLEGDEDWIDCLNPTCKICTCDEGIIHAGKEQFYSYLANTPLLRWLKGPEIKVRWHIDTQVER